ncbi:peptidase M15 [Neopusillimonas maritima]|uniref:D-alanyl-D-alanine dipeptidase n=2 Tax=Neopusillimonas maritima TaxID=2026239 RepID=A0A3A1YV09_9BURK|nr:peptidase M15 [Neopusillimonas maritima]
MRTRFHSWLFGLVLAMSSLFPSYAIAHELPAGFTYLEEAIPEIKINLMYTGSDNFLGRPVNGYENARAVLTKSAAQALKQAQDSLKPFGLGLLVYDAYRPQRAVDDFIAWSRTDNNEMRESYYPDISKPDLFKEGYIAAKSGHSRGSTVDLTLCDLNTGKPLDMGTRIDFLGKESWPDYAGVTGQQRANRLLLRRIMMEHGFMPLQQEWWHFTLENEPFPETYFDFVAR